MSGVYLSGVIGRLSIYCNLPVLECLSLGKGGSIGLVEYISIAMAAMDSDSTMAGGYYLDVG